MTGLGENIHVVTLSCDSNDRLAAAAGAMPTHFAQMGY
jgi:hypothetical protein